MAVRRSTMRKQVVENLSQVAPPGETFIACLHCETGPSPWLNVLFERVPFLVLIIQILRKYYFITLTNTSIVINRASRLSNRPKEVVYSVHRSVVPFSGIKRGKVWSRAYFQFPDKPKPTRINFHRIWNADLDHFIAAFPQAAHGNEQYGQMPQSVPQFGQPLQQIPQQAHPQYAHPQHGHPQHGQPQYAQPQHGHPQYAQPQHGQPQYAQPQHGHPQYAQPQHGQPQYGSPAPGQHPGHPQYGPPEPGQPPRW